MKKEKKINLMNLFKNDGWIYCDNNKREINIITKQNFENKVSSSINLEELQSNSNDHIILDEKGLPYVFLKSVAEEQEPLDKCQDARVYAEYRNIRFIILSNGTSHYFWDLKNGDPKKIAGYLKYDAIKRIESIESNLKLLYEKEIDSDYIVLSQNPDYMTNPNWINESLRDGFVKDQGLHFLRPHQLRAIRAFQEALRAGKDRYYFEMCENTGRSIVAAAITKLFISTGNAKKILYIGDRFKSTEYTIKNNINIVKIKINFNIIYKKDKPSVVFDTANNIKLNNYASYLKNEFICASSGDTGQCYGWEKADIVILYQYGDIISQKFKRVFSPIDFDLIISDEAHMFDVFKYFIGYKLAFGRPSIGTPYSRREFFFNIYKDFCCEPRQPTFRYSMLDAVKDGYVKFPKKIDKIGKSDILNNLTIKGGWYNYLPHERNKYLMLKKKRQLVHWDTIWKPECDQIILRYIIEFGASWIYQNSSIIEHLKQILPLDGVDKEMCMRLFDYCIHRVWSGVIPGAMEKWNEAHMIEEITAYKCQHCGEECLPEYANEEMKEAFGPFPTICRECYYVITRFVQDEQLSYRCQIAMEKEQVEDFCRRMRVKHVCERCGENYWPVDIIYNYPIGVRTIYIQMNINLCERCLVAASNRKNVTEIKQEDIDTYNNMLKVIGWGPEAGWEPVADGDWNELAYELTDVNKIRRLLEINVKLPSPGCFYNYYGSVFAFLVAAGVFPEGTKKMARGTLILAMDGHLCSSIGEWAIDNWLTVQGISHEREPSYPDSRFRADWKLLLNPEIKKPVYVEYFGLAGNIDYDKISEKKKVLAHEKGIYLISIMPRDDYKKIILEAISILRNL